MEKSLEDLKSHRTAWRNALVLALADARNKKHEDDSLESAVAADGDITYWSHELKVFDRVFTDICGPVGWNGTVANLREQLGTLDELAGMGEAIPDNVISDAKKNWPGPGKPLSHVDGPQTEDQWNSMHAKQELAAKELCEDEGCPQHGTEHICNPRPDIKSPDTEIGGLPRYSDNRDPTKYEVLRTCRLLGPAIYTSVVTTGGAMDPETKRVDIDVTVQKIPVNIFKNETTGEISIVPGTSREFQPIDNTLSEEPAGDMLKRVGMDGLLWAEEFNKTAVALGYMKMNEAWLHGWFANAIMAGFDTAQNRYDPERREQRIRLGLSLPDPKDFS